MGAKLLYRDTQGRDAAADLSAGGSWLGRATECLVRTDDANVSRRHCKISMQASQWYVEDLGSAHGTYIVTESSPERRVEREQLKHGDIIRCGSLQVRFVETSNRSYSAWTRLSLKFWRHSTPADTKQQIFDLTSNGEMFYIGKDADCAIRITESEHISRKHAIISFTDGKYILQDNYSATGIKLFRGGEIILLRGNGIRLMDFDRLAVADYLFGVSIASQCAEVYSEAPVLKASAPMPPVTELSVVKALTENGKIAGSLLHIIPTNSSIRKLLDKIFPTDSDLDAFLIDCLPDVKKRCSSSMERKAKVNLLFELIEPVQIVNIISGYVDGFERYIDILEF